MIQVLHPHGHVNADGFFESTVIFSCTGDMSPSSTVSPPFKTMEKSKMYMDSVIRTIYLLQVEAFFKAMKSAGLDVIRIMAGLKYFHDQDISLKDIAQFMQRIEVELIRKPINTIKLPARLEYLAEINDIMDFAKKIVDGDSH